MSRRIVPIVAGVVLLLAALTPLANCFDTWDKTTQPPANDTEIHLTALFVWAGFVVVLPKLVRRFRISAAAQRSAFALHGIKVPAIAAPMPEPSASPPPLSLRI